MCSCHSSFIQHTHRATTPSIFQPVPPSLSPLSPPYSHAGAPCACLCVQRCVGLHKAGHVSYVHTQPPAPTTQGLYAQSIIKVTAGSKEQCVCVDITWQVCEFVSIQGSRGRRETGDKRQVQAAHAAHKATVSSPSNPLPTAQHPEPSLTVQ